jgi:predicted small lipoprotein YifL
VNGVQTVMRLFLLALPVLLTVLTLVACGGKGGGGY